MFVLAPAASPAASKRTGPSINPLLRSLYLARPGWKHCRFCSVRWFKAGAELSSHVLVISCYTVPYIIICIDLFVQNCSNPLAHFISTSTGGADTRWSWSCHGWRVSIRPCLCQGPFQLQFELDTLKDGDDSDDGRNPAPVDRWFIPLFIGFQPSKVVQDFFHPP